jgi:hypothetical protein
LLVVPEMKVPVAPMPCTPVKLSTPKLMAPAEPLATTTLVPTGGDKRYHTAPAGVLARPVVTAWVIATPP